MTVNVTAYGPNGPTISQQTIEASGFDKLRIEAEGSGDTTISNGPVTSIVEGSHVSIVPTRCAGAGVLALLPWLAVLHDAGDPTSSLTDKGLQQTDSGVVHRIQVRRPIPPNNQSFDYEVAIDPVTQQIVSIKLARESPGNSHSKVNVEIRFGNYQTVGGVGVPMEIEEYIRGHKTSDIQITSIAVNPELPADHFQVRTN